MMIKDELFVIDLEYNIKKGQWENFSEDFNHDLKDTIAILQDDTIPYDIRYTLAYIDFCNIYLFYNVNNFDKYFQD